MIGVGLDAVDVQRFRAVLQRRPALLVKVFSETERLELAGRADPVPGFAARFAAKEATMKALGVGLGAFAFYDVEVLTRSSGAPELKLSGRAAKLAEQAGVSSVHVSLTHTNELAGAVVLLA